MTLDPIPLNFLIYAENLIFSFNSVHALSGGGGFDQGVHLPRESSSKARDTYKRTEHSGTHCSRTPVSSPNKWSFVLPVIGYNNGEKERQL